MSRSPECGARMPASEGGSVGEGTHRQRCKQRSSRRHCSLGTSRTLLPRLSSNCSFCNESQDTQPADTHQVELQVKTGSSLNFPSTEGSECLEMPEKVTLVLLLVSWFLSPSHAFVRGVCKWQSLDAGGNHTSNNCTVKAAISAEERHSSIHSPNMCELTCSLIGSGKSKARRKHSFYP